MYEQPDTVQKIVDFYHRPFMYIYCGSDTSSVYLKLVDDIRQEYEKYLYTKLPLVSDMGVTLDTLSRYNIFLIGSNFNNPHVQKFCSQINIDEAKVSDGKNYLISYKHPYNKDGMVLLYTTQKESQFLHTINYPWIYGFAKVLCSE